MSTITRITVATSAAALAVLTACSSSGGGTGPAANAANTSGNAAGGGGSVTISVKHGVLVAPDGHTLYSNTADSPTKVICTGACASIWPPLTGTPHAGSGLTAAQLGTATRPDGSTQATWRGLPLYEFSKDKAPGDKTGDGISDAGGTWHPATAAKAAAPATHTSAPASTSPGYNYGGGY